MLSSVSPPPASSQGGLPPQPADLPAPGVPDNQCAGPFVQLAQRENPQDHIPLILQILQAVRPGPGPGEYTSPARADGSRFRADFRVEGQVTLSAVKEGEPPHHFTANPRHLQAWSVLSAFREHVALLAGWRKWAEGPSGSGEMRAEAMDRMVACQLTDRKALNLSGLALRSLPAHLPDGYTRLNVSGNLFTLETEADGGPGLRLHRALKKGHDGTVTAYLAAMQAMVKDDHLDKEQALALVRAEVDGLPGLSLALQDGGGGVVTAYLDGMRAMVSGDHLDKAQVPELLRADADGVTGLHLAQVNHYVRRRKRTGKACGRW